MPIVVAIVFLNLIIDCIIEALANPERERLKHEDTNISEWLKSMIPCSDNLLALLLVIDSRHFLSNIMKTPLCHIG